MSHPWDPSKSKEILSRLGKLRFTLINVQHLHKCVKVEKVCYVTSVAVKCQNVHDVWDVESWDHMDSFLDHRKVSWTFWFVFVGHSAPLSTIVMSPPPFARITWPFSWHSAIIAIYSRIKFDIWNAWNRVHVKYEFGTIWFRFAKNTCRRQLIYYDCKFEMFSI